MHEESGQKSNPKNPRLFSPIYNQGGVEYSTAPNEKHKAVEILLTPTELLGRLGFDNPQLLNELQNIAKRLSKLGMFTYARKPEDTELKNAQGRGHSHLINLKIAEKIIPTPVYVKGIGSYSSFDTDNSDPDFPGFTTGNTFESIFFDDASNNHLRTWGNNTIKWSALEFGNLAAILINYINFYGFESLDQIIESGLPVPIAITEFYNQTRKKLADIKLVQQNIINELSAQNFNIKPEQLTKSYVESKLEDEKVYAQMNQASPLRQNIIHLLKQLLATFTDDNRFGSLTMITPSMHRVGQLYHGYEGDEYFHNLKKVYNPEIIANFARTSQTAITQFGLVFSPDSCHIQNLSDNPNSIFPFFDYSDIMFLGLYSKDMARVMIFYYLLGSKQFIPDYDYSNPDHISFEEFQIAQNIYWTNLLEGFVSKEKLLIFSTLAPFHKVLGCIVGAEILLANSKEPAWEKIADDRIKAYHYLDQNLHLDIETLILKKVEDSTANFDKTAQAIKPENYEHTPYYEELTTFLRDQEGRIQSKSLKFILRITETLKNKPNSKVKDRFYNQFLSVFKDNTPDDIEKYNPKIIENVILNLEEENWDNLENTLWYIEGYKTLARMQTELQPEKFEHYLNKLNSATTLEDRNNILMQLSIHSFLFLFGNIEKVLWYLTKILTPFSEQDDISFEKTLILGSLNNDLENLSFLNYFSTDLSDIIALILDYISFKNIESKVILNQLKLFSKFNLQKFTNGLVGKNPKQIVAKLQNEINKINDGLATEFTEPLLDSYKTDYLKSLKSYLNDVLENGLVESELFKLKELVNSLATFNDRNQFEKLKKYSKVNYFISAVQRAETTNLSLNNYKKVCSELIYSIDRLFKEARNPLKSLSALKLLEYAMPIALDCDETLFDILPNLNFFLNIYKPYIIKKQQ
jgi:hypothetical protein